MKNIAIRKAVWLGIAVVTGLAAIPAGSVRAETLLQDVQEHLMLSVDGKVAIERKDSVRGDALAKLYSRHDEALRKDPRVRDNFVNEQRKTYALSYGSAPAFQARDAQASAQGFIRNMSGGFQLPPTKLGRMELRHNMWPESRDDKNFALFYEQTLDGFVFSSAFLAALPGEQDLAAKTTTRIDIPSGLRLLNADKLQGQKWSVDFGGGNTMTSTLQVIGDGRAVVLTRQVAVTKQTPTRLLSPGSKKEVASALRRFEMFMLQFDGGKGGLILDPLKTPNSGLDDGEAIIMASAAASEDVVGEIDYSGKWSKDFLSNSISQNFQYPPKSVPPVTPNLTLALTETIGIATKAALGWEWCGWFDACTIKSFNASASASPTATATAVAHAAVQCDPKGAKNCLDRSTNVLKLGDHIFFWVGPVPVDLAYAASIDARATLSASAVADLTAKGALAFTAGFQANWNGSWKFVPTGTATRSGSLSGSAKGTVDARAGVPVSVSVMLYDAAGPFVGVEPYVQAIATATASISTTTGNVQQNPTTPNDKTGCASTQANQAKLKIVLNAGMDGNYGITLNGWLADLLDLKKTYSDKFSVVQPIPVWCGIVT